jgi:multidrug efflux pump
MSTLFYRNTRLLILALAMIAVGGLSAFMAIPRLEDPVITNRFASVLTRLPGASAKRVESLVSEKIEAAIREVAEVKTISSSSRNGLSILRVELRDSVADVEPVWSRIRDKISDIRTQLPANASEPDFDSDRTYAYTLIAGIVWDQPGKPNRAILRRFGLELESRLRNVGGTALVRLFGAPEEEILVRADPAKLASLRLTAADISAAIANADAKVSAGQLRAKANDLLIEVRGELTTLDRIRRIPIREAPDGSIVRVGDVATVDRTIAQPPRVLATLDGKPAVMVATRMEFDRRVDRWSTAVRADIAAFRAQLPDGLKLQIVFDQADYTDARLSDLMVNLLIGAGLVIIVLLITLGWRSAVVVALTLPLTSLIALTTLNIVGIPIHQMSVTGLIVALGLLVDNAIVMTDQIRQKRAAGFTPLQAIDSSVRHLWLPLAASTVTTILAFMPIMLMPGPAGEFVSAIGLSVTIALISSYLLSLTVIAALGGRFVKAALDQRTRWWLHGVRLPRLGKLFEKSLDLSLRHPRKSMLAAMVMPLIGFGAAGGLTEQFFPPADRDQFHIEVTLPGHSSIAATRALTKAAEARLRAHKDIEHVHWFIGASAPSFYYNLLQSKDGLANYAQAMIKVKSIGAAKRLIPILQKEMDKAFPQARVLVKPLEQGPPFDAPIELRIYGPDLNTLQRLGEEYRRVLTRVPSVTHTSTSLDASAPKIWFRIDEDKAQLAGLRLVDVANQLNLGLEGVRGGSIIEGTEVIPVRLRLGARGELKDILALTFVGTRSPNAEGKDFPGVPLTALGDVTLGPVLREIARRDGERVNTVQGYLRAGILPQAGLNAYRKLLDQAKVPLPPGYRVQIGGESEKRNESVNNLAASMGIIVTLMIAVIVLSFNSFKLGGVVFAVAGQALGLGLLSLAVFDYPLGFVVLIGLMGLIGLAVNAAIIITASLRASESARDGDPLEVRKTVVGETSRHIVSTTITTVGGFMPLILAEGGFWPPFAVAIAGGTLLSTVLSFYFVPAAYLLIARARVRKEQRSLPGSTVPA